MGRNWGREKLGSVPYFPIFEKLGAVPSRNWGLSPIFLFSASLVRNRRWSHRLLVYHDRARGIVWIDKESDPIAD
jgi:hypothetical protein